MAPDRRTWPAPGPALVGLAVAVGLALGIGAYMFVYARGASYLTNDPAACANCHVMREQLDGWTVGSHRAVAAARDFQRRAQFYLDFVEAENSTGFHAPQEAARILAESIDFTRQGQLALRDARTR
jgi:Cytochrome c552